MKPEDIKVGDKVLINPEYDTQGKKIMEPSNAQIVGMFGTNCCRNYKLHDSQKT